MGFLDWLIEHILEVIITIISSTGLYYVIKINNQKINLNNSPNSPVFQIGEMKGSNITLLKEGLDKEKGIFGKVPSGEEKPKDLLKKIQTTLDDNKSLHIVAEMCLRLAQKLKIKEDEEWLNKEVYGFEELLKEEDQKKGMKLRKSDDKYSYRSINTELNLQFKNGKIETFPLKMFMSKPLSQIESWINNFKQSHSSIKELVMNAPPLEIMVETLNVSPEERVPYRLSISELENVVQEVRKKILKFLEKASEKLEN